MFSWLVPRILIPFLLTLGLLHAAGFGGGYTLSNPVSYNYSPILNSGDFGSAALNIAGAIPGVGSARSAANLAATHGKTVWRLPCG